MQFLNSNIGYAVGDSGRIIKTFDSGLTWTKLTSGTNCRLNAVKFLNIDTGWAVGHLGTILQTIDGGQNWTIIPSGTTKRLYCVDFLDINNGWVAGESGFNISTDNSGSTWNSHFINYNDVKNIHMIDANNVWLIGYTTSKTNNGGVSWNINYYGGINDLEFLDSNTFIGVGDYGTMIKTTNAGTNWNILESRSISWNIYETQFINSNTGWCVSIDGIFKTTNSGINWDFQIRPNDYLQSICFIIQITAGQLQKRYY